MDEDNSTWSEIILSRLHRLTPTDFASAVGAERAILVTLGRFSAPARKAARSATPNIDLIDGERLCELLLSKQVGVMPTPVVDPAWFDRFD